MLLERNCLLRPLKVLPANEKPTPEIASGVVLEASKIIFKFVTGKRLL
jgi:hypothetical protein